MNCSSWHEEFYEEFVICRISQMPEKFSTCSFPDNILISHLDSDWFDILFYEHCVLKLIATDIVILSYIFNRLTPKQGNKGTKIERCIECKRILEKYY